MKFRNNQFKSENVKRVLGQLLKDYKKEKVIYLIELVLNLTYQSEIF